MGKTTAWKLAFSVLVIVTLIVTAGYWKEHARNLLNHWDPDLARSHGYPIPVRTEKIAETKVDEAIGATAVTVPAESATIRVVQGSAPRELTAVRAKLGSVVKQGDMLFEFNEELFAQAVRQRKAALASAEEALTAVQKLYSQKAASGLDLSDAKVKVETAKLDLVMSQQDLKDCRVASPIDGVVADVQAVAGEKIDTTVDITQVHRLDPILVQMDFPLERIDALFVGQSAEIVLDSFPRETFSGKVLRISPVADTETRVLPVMIELPNPGNRIKAGLTGFVRIRATKQAKTIPSAALIREGSKAMAFRIDKEADQSIAHAQEVRIGPLMKDGKVEILEGLNDGDEIVLFGNFTLKDLDRVDPNWEGWTHR